jgi:hypothetical protein
VRQTRRRTPTLSPPSLSLFTARVSPERRKKTAPSAFRTGMATRTPCYRP